MKPVFKTLVFSALALSLWNCKGSQFSGRTETDDMYFSSSDRKIAAYQEAGLSASANDISRQQENSGPARNVNPEYISQYAEQARQRVSEEQAGTASETYSEGDTYSSEGYYDENYNGSQSSNLSNTNWNSNAAATSSFCCNPAWNWTYSYSPWVNPYTWYDPYFSPYVGGWGWSRPRSGWYLGWNSRGGWYSGFSWGWGPSWYDPFYGYGYGGGWGWNSWGYNNYYDGYYRGFYNGYYAGGNRDFSRRSVVYGPRSPRGSGYVSNYRNGGRPRIGGVANPGGNSGGRIADSGSGQRSIATPERYRNRARLANETGRSSERFSQPANVYNSGRTRDAYSGTPSGRTQQNAAPRSTAPQNERPRMNPRSSGSNANGSYSAPTRTRSSGSGGSYSPSPRSSGSSGSGGGGRVAPSGGSSGGGRVSTPSGGGSRSSGSSSGSSGSRPRRH